MNYRKSLFFTLLLYCMFNAHGAEQLSPQDWDNGTLIGAMQGLVEESERLHQMPSSNEVIEKINQAQALFTQYLEIYLNQGQLFVQKNGYFGAQSFAIGSVDNPNNPISPAEYTLLLTTLEYAAHHNNWATAINLEMACMQGRTMVDKRLYLHEIISALKKVPLSKGYSISSVAQKAAIGVTLATGAAIAIWYLYNNSKNVSPKHLPPALLGANHSPLFDANSAPSATENQGSADQGHENKTSREEQIANIEGTNFIAPTTSGQNSGNTPSIATDENGQSYGIVDLLPKRLQDVYRQSGGDMSAVYDAANGWEIAELTGKGLVAGTLAGGIAYGTVKAGKSLLGKYKEKDPVLLLEAGGSSNTNTLAKEAELLLKAGGSSNLAKEAELLLNQADQAMAKALQSKTLEDFEAYKKAAKEAVEAAQKLQKISLQSAQISHATPPGLATPDQIADKALETAEAAAARTGYQGANGNTARNIDNARKALMEDRENVINAPTSSTRYINKIKEKR